MAKKVNSRYLNIHRDHSIVNDENVDPTIRSHSSFQTKNRSYSNVFSALDVNTRMRAPSPLLDQKSRTPVHISSKIRETLSYHKPQVPLTESVMQRNDIADTRRNMDKTCSQITKFRRNLENFTDFLKQFNQGKPAQVSEPEIVPLQSTRAFNFQSILNGANLESSRGTENIEPERPSTPYDDMKVVLDTCLSGVSKIKSELAEIRKSTNKSFSK